MDIVCTLYPVTYSLPAQQFHRVLDRDLLGGQPIQHGAPVGAIVGLGGRSALARKYNQNVDRESAYEILNEKIAEFQASQPAPKTGGGKEEKSMVEEVLTSTAARQIGNTVARELTRGLLGVLGLGGSSRSRRKTGWF